MRARQGIPLSDLRNLAHTVRRTSVVRLALAAALIATLGAAAWLARAPGASGASGVDGGESGLVVLDLSASIGEPGARLRGPFEYLAATGHEFGLVRFSAVAYEAIPPGTASSELRGFLRALTPLRQRFCVAGQSAPCPSGARRVAPNSPALRDINRRSLIPWNESFRTGTQISTGLRLGREVLARHGLRERGVLLISDLDNAFEDIPAVMAELRRYKRERIPLHIVALSPHNDDRALFEQLAGKSAFVDRADLAAGLAERRERATAAIPEALAGLAVLLLILLAANEHFCGRLTWRSGPRAAVAR